MHTFLICVAVALASCLITAIFSYRHHEQEKETLREAVQLGRDLYGKIQFDIQAVILEATKAGHSVKDAAQKIFAAVGL